uniref:Chromosome 9 open reading frame 50 n=1 Tax=Moschus moschiferus TaxID=68415 RepID=A0A8C6FII1_MOSMO
PGGSDRRRRDPLLPRLLRPELRAASGPGVFGVSRASESGAESGRAPACESLHSDHGLGFRSARSRLPVLPTVAQRPARSRTGLRSLLPPPLLLAGESPESAPACPKLRQREDPRRGSAKETSDSLGSLLEVLPGRFRQFLRQFRAESAEPLLPPTPSASQHQRHPASAFNGSPPRGSSSHLLPDLGGQSSYLKNSLKKILLHQIPALGPLSRDYPQFTTVKANQPQATQALKLKAVLTHNSSREGSGHRRRCCPFRVRFADETLRDAALRYWERSCTARQGIFEDRTANPRSTASDRVFGSVGRWLESLPKALYPSAKEETAGSPVSCDFPGLSTLEPKGHLPEDTSVNSSLPFIPRATAQRQQGDLKTFLEQVGKSSCSWSQKLESFLPSLVLHTVLKRGCPKGYQLLLPSASHRR